MEQERLQQAMQLMVEINAEREKIGYLDIEGNRNAEDADLFEAIIREAYDSVVFVACGHHLMVSIKDTPVPIEIPSADTLMFDHDVAIKIWKDGYQNILTHLALEPAATRNSLLRKLYYGR